MKAEKEKCDELLLRIAGNDRSALEELYGIFKSQVYGLALAILKNHTDAEDVMQNVFVRVWDRANQYRSGTDPGAWIMKIARNLSMDRLRTRKGTADIMTLEDIPDGGDDFAPSLDRILLRELLAELNSGERQIVMLHAVGGYSHKEIAEIVGRPYATVRWKYGNAMKKLKLFLEREDFYERKTQFESNR